MGENDFKKTFKPLREKIEMFTNIHGLVRQGLTEWHNVVGINASPFLRFKKKQTMGRVQEQIDNLNAPFKIKDYDEKSTYFKIMVKQ